MKARFKIFAVVLVLIGAAIWMKWPQRSSKGLSVPPASPKATMEAKAPNPPAPTTNATPSSSALAEMWRRFEISVSKRALNDAVESGDPRRWRPIMGQARHFNLPREKGIALLLPYLAHPNSQVREAAAQYLFELGSRQGGPVLIAFLKDAADGKRVDADLVNAAAVLHQYRYHVEGDLIYAAHQKNPNSRLLMYAQLLGSQEAIPETQRRLQSLGIMDGALQMAGLMGLKDPKSMAVYQRYAKSERTEDREFANAALYRVTGDRQYLDYLITVAEEVVGLKPRSDKLGGFAGSEAFLTLQHTRLPEATAALRRLEGSLKN